MGKITPFLWFDDNAEEAVQFYKSVFKNVRVLNEMRYGEGGPGPAGSIMTITFEVEGQTLTGLNGGPHFKFNEAISLFVDCEDQAEVDYYWDKLTSDGGEPGHCGWLKDKFGLSWQIIPMKQLGQYLGGSDKEGAGRAMQAMLQMQKLEVDGLRKAYEGQ